MWDGVNAIKIYKGSERDESWVGLQFEIGLSDKFLLKWWHLSKDLKEVREWAIEMSARRWSQIELKTRAKAWVSASHVASQYNSNWELLRSSWNPHWTPVVLMLCKWWDRMAHRWITNCNKVALLRIGFYIVNSECPWIVSFYKFIFHLANQFPNCWDFLYDLFFFKLNYEKGLWS